MSDVVLWPLKIWEVIICKPVVNVAPGHPWLWNIHPYDLAWPSWTPAGLVEPSSCTFTKDTLGRGTDAVGEGGPRAIQADFQLWAPKLVAVVNRNSEFYLPVFGWKSRCRVEGLPEVEIEAVLTLVLYHWQLTRPWLDSGNDRAQVLSLTNTQSLLSLVYHSDGSLNTHNINRFATHLTSFNYLPNNGT